MGAAGDLVEKILGAVRERHFAGVDFKDFPPAAGVGRTDEDFPVKPPRPAERRIDGVDAVGGTDHDDRIDALETIHQR